tara:strand:+ start:426 stop:572 length:147 start_codon:yes stop_codon:yes gene_type:complete
MFQDIKDAMLDTTLSHLNTALHYHIIELMESITQTLEEFQELAEKIGE